MNTKICCTCKRDLPATEFSKGTASADGLQPMCKSCYKEYRRQRNARIKQVLHNARVITDYTAEELFAELGRRGFQFIMTYAPLNTEAAEESVE